MFELGNLVLGQERYLEDRWGRWLFGGRRWLDDGDAWAWRGHWIAFLSGETVEGRWQYRVHADMVHKPWSGGL